ncbi:MAG: proton-conducting transporter membrane subunit, partial [Thermodesulfobacteriota bacterium]
VDALSAFFLVPVCLLSALGSVYGLGYWSAAARPGSAARVRAWYGLLGGSLALLLGARDGVLFLCAWEGMALSAFFLVATEDEVPEVRDAAWVYLVATHAGTLLLMGAFAVLCAGTGSFSLLESALLESGAASAAFLLALGGFGLKAGLQPLHVWLPPAHANAPSHVSALLSGVVIKMGIYGILRITGLLPVPPAWWGWLVLGLGAVSAVLGVAYALGQHDLKRLLAYHSVENIGIIALGVGLALLGRSAGRPEWVVLGLGGGLLHVWNHGLFKGLLFLCAGSVIHAAHTREMDHLGGLAKRMPWTAAAFGVGAVAICGLPPLNGFVSEFLVYLGLFRTALAEPGRDAGAWPAAALAAPALAMVGALAVACFVKAFGAVFLGEPRSGHGRGAVEAPPSMLGPMAVLAAACAAIGLFPWALGPVLDRAVGAWGMGPGAWGTGSGGAALPPVTELAPLSAVGALALGLTALLGLGALWVRARLRRRPPEPAVTWDCGYAAPSARMQYSASSFAQILVGLFSWALAPVTRLPGLSGPFPGTAAFESRVPDAVLDRALRPVFAGAAELLGRLRVFQQGRVQAYVAYVLATLVVLFLWR